MISSKRDRSASRALVLGLLSLPFGILAPFAIWVGMRSLGRIRAAAGALSGETSAAAGVAGGFLGMAGLILGTGYWLVAS